MGTNHAGSLRDLGYEVAAGTDVVEEKRTAFEEEYGAATYEDAEAMLESETLDGVVVTTPNAYHAPAAIAALERDVTVMCEKPLADTLDNAERIAAAARESDAGAMVGFHSRFSTAGEVLADHREAGRFGEITHVEGSFIRRRGIPGVGSWFTAEELSGGGALIDIGVHLIDFALYLAGFPDPVEVSGTTRSEFGDREDYSDPDGWSGNWDTGQGTFDVDDSASAFVRCADGTTLSLEVAWATNREPDRTLRLRGTEAGAQCALAGDEVTILETGTGGVDHYSDATLSGSLDPSGHRAEIAYFADAVAAGEVPTRNSVDQALTVQRVIDAVYRSSEAGEAVTVE